MPAPASATAPFRFASTRPWAATRTCCPTLSAACWRTAANTSFVHALLDERTPVEKVVSDPIAAVEATGGAPHARIPLPVDLYGPSRRNSGGMDLSIAATREALAGAIAALPALDAGPIVGGKAGKSAAALRVSPADLAKTIGAATDATAAQVDAAYAAAARAQPAWNDLGGEGRAPILRAMADALEAHRERLIAICTAEAGKTLSDGVAEVREAADFCRYYASLAERQFGAPETLRGPVGETNQLSLHGRGVFACISPWNFPLAIFTGQIAAALAAGNAVLAKPAEQTPLIAAEAVRLFHGAGLDPNLLHLLPGDGATIGQALVAHPTCAGVAFTGGTDTAWAINRTLAARQGPIVPFIAETGGLNAMFVDTTALREQVIDDVIASALRPRPASSCSALRMLFVPHDTAGTPWSRAWPAPWTPWWSAIPPIRVRTSAR